MHPFSILTLAIFVAGYITARWDLVTRIYELAIFAWVNGVIVRTALYTTPTLHVFFQTRCLIYFAALVSYRSRLRLSEFYISTRFHTGAAYRA